MSKIVKVTYDSQSLKTTITVDGKPFDTSRIDGKEIADWVYPFMMRKIKWNGFYDEMVEALGGEKAFDLIFEGDESALDELKEAWEDAPVNIISESESGNVVDISYDENSLNTTIAVNGKPFDTSRINGKEIADWVYPFMMRKVKWNGIFEELANAVGSDEYTIQFLGSNDAMKELMEECPERVTLIKAKDGNTSSNTSQMSATHIVSEIEDASEIERQAFILHRNGNIEEAVKLHLKAAKLGDISAMINIGDCYYRGEGVEQDYSKAVKWYTKIAENGHYVGQDNLGKCYLYGYGVNQDYDKAVELFTKSAEQGYDRAQLNLGLCFVLGNGISQDYRKAFEWFDKAAKQGNYVAQNNLGECYYYGYGVCQDYSKAVEWYTKAVEQGYCDPDIFYHLGICYYCGNGVNRDYSKAVDYFAKAAGEGNKDALYFLGICFYYGRGVNQDFSRAVEFFTDAAENDNSYALNMLGDCYYEGKGVAQSYPKAFQLYTQALDADDENGTTYYNLGTCYRWGNGVRKDKEKAKELFQKGINLSNENCSEAYNDMLKNTDRIDTAKKIGGGILNVLGNIAMGVAQTSYSNSSSNDYYDDDDEY